MLKKDARVKNSDAAQPRVTNVKTHNPPQRYSHEVGEIPILHVVFFHGDVVVSVPSVLFVEEANGVAQLVQNYACLRSGSVGV